MKFEKDLSNPETGNAILALTGDEYLVVKQALDRLPDACVPQVSDVMEVLDGMPRHQDLGMYWATVSPRVAGLVAMLHQLGNTSLPDDPALWSAILGLPEYGTHALCCLDVDEAAQVPQALVTIHNPPWASGQGQDPDVLFESIQDEYNALTAENGDDPGFADYAVGRLRDMGFDVTVARF